jgi:excinuclease ABC subunit B
MANVIEQTNKPAADHQPQQDASPPSSTKSSSELFPNNAVSYFVSYYDYYQPEAYIPQRDIYIEKDASRNDDLDRLRLAATSNLSQPARRDHRRVGVVHLRPRLARGIQGWSSIERGQRSTAGLPPPLSDLQYAAQRHRLQARHVPRAGRRDRGLHPAYEEFAYRIELFGDEIDALQLINPTTGSCWPRRTSCSSTRRCTTSCRRAARTRPGDDQARNSTNR